MHILIIGNGVAGFEAALEIRRRKPCWDITIVSEESEHFFSRTALMYALSGQLRKEEMEPYERDAYKTFNLKRIKGRAVKLNAPRKEVELHHGIEERATLSFDKLVLACGSKPRKPDWPGTELLGVGHFVTLQDLEWLEQELQTPFATNPHSSSQKHSVKSPYQPINSAFSVRRQKPQSPIVIGGGLIGIEVVETLVSMGYRPRFFIREQWFWPIVLDKNESSWIANKLRHHGVEIHFEEEVQKLLGNSQHCIREVQTDKGQYASDLVVVAIGVVPNTSWLESSPLELDSNSKGIVVDAKLQTNIKDIFAIGDCAAVEWFDGKRKPEQLWYTSRDQGKICGRVICGEDQIYERGIWYNSAKLMDIEYTTVGYVGAGLNNLQSWYFEETGKVKSTTRILHEEGVVKGFNLLGRRWDHEILCEWVEEEKTLQWVLENLNMASFDTEFVSPLIVPKQTRTLK